jgi:triacylglycerol esterase/lipase EstA (alpha/beta hydrolase family)
VLTAALAWRASHALGSFFVAAVMRGRDGRREVAGTTWQALVSEFRARLVSFNWSQPFAHIVMRPEPAGHGSAVPILLVHGYFSNHGMWVRFRQRLVNSHLGPVFTINLEPPMASIDDLVEQLQLRIAQIAEETGEDRLHIIAHSMGGLVVRAYLSAVARADQIVSFITLGSPHHGSALAAFGLGRCVKQIRPGSTWLTSLAAREARLNPKPSTLSIYTCNDDLVYPPESAVLPWAENIAVRGIGHVGLLFSEDVFEIVKKRITSIDGNLQVKSAENARQ